MSETSTASPYMKTKELAAILHTTPNAIRVMRHRGQAPKAMRRGRELLFRRSVVEAWLKAREDADTLSQRAAA